MSWTEKIVQLSLKMLSLILTLQIHFMLLVYIYINNKKYNYLFITCYFEDKQHVNRKLHNPNNYRKWITTFFKNINKNNVIVFTDNKTFMKLYNPLKIYYYESIESVPINKNKKELYEYQMKIDNIKLERNWITKMIWNSKIYFMEKSTINFDSQIYIWIDIGCMRYEQNYSNLPDLTRINILSKNKEMSFFITRKTTFIPYKIYSNMCWYLIAGTFFGSKESILKFSHKYHYILNYYLKNRIYFGTEQNIYDITVLQYFKNSIIYPLYQSNCEEQSVIWKFIKFYTNDLCNSFIIPYKYHTKIEIDIKKTKNNTKC